MGGGAQLREPVGRARLEAENGSAGRQGCDHLSSDAERIACRKLHGHQAAQRQNHGQCRPPRYRGGMMRAHRLALVSAASALMFALGMPAGAATSTWPDISGIYWT